MEKGIISMLLMLALALSQPTYNKQCAEDSYIPLLATGSIKLNPLDIDTGSANKNYYQDLSNAKFNTIDVLGYGFALSGFKTTCDNDYYTLVVHTVKFENQNTRMKIVVDFRNPQNDQITKWTLVWFNYIVVSRNLNGAYSDIWATVAEIRLTEDITSSVDYNGTRYMSIPAGTCSIYDDPHYSFDSSTCFDTDAAVADLQGGTAVIHAYIMGFRWDRNAGSSSNSSYLAAAILNGGSTLGGLNPSTDETNWTVNFISPAGPVVRINTFGGSLRYIKVAFVLSRLDSYFIGTASSSSISREYIQYQSGPYLRSNLLYSSSYIYQRVTLFNQTVTLRQASNPSEYNYNYYKLPDKRYSIYGLSSFQLPISSSYTCTTLQVTVILNTFDTYTVYTPNLVRNHFLISGDIFTQNIWDLCAPANPIQGRFQNKITLGQKVQIVVPSQNSQQYIQQDITLLKIPTNSIYSGILGNQNEAIYMNYYAQANGDTQNIIYKVEIPFTGIQVGAPLKLQFGFFDGPHPLSQNSYNPNKLMINGHVYTITLEVNGYIMYNIKYTGGSTTFTDPASNVFNRVGGILRGINVQQSVAVATITISFQRHQSLDQSMFTYILVSQYFHAYDPSTGCCTQQCPSETGLDVSLVVPVCVTCDTQMGLWYNPNNGTCTCLPGYYLDPSKTFQCYPCQTIFCDMCNPYNPTKCFFCASGAQLNANQTCNCSNGYFINGTKCQQCPYKCQTCSPPNAQCQKCVDSQHRDIAQDCKCISGYYDSGSVNCTKCMSSCLTCTNASSCETCNSSEHRRPQGVLCVCIDGYYQFYNNDQTRQCKPCSPVCKTCSVAPTACTSCDADKNRVAGIDQNGHQTCQCLPGFYSTDDGSCVQSDCNADPFCSECEQGLQLCIKCLTSKNRVIQMPEAKCVCEQGYYQDANKDCVRCGTGCSICKSATECTSCVALATPAQQPGICQCPDQTFFKISPTGVPYCAACVQYCKTCQNETSCEVCLPGVTKTIDNKCICGKGRYLDQNSNCVPCFTGCQICQSSTNCTKCAPPLMLQANECKNQCQQGYIVSGGQCKACPDGCLQCSDSMICFYCADSKYAYNGLCYDICPPGTVGSQQTSNWACIPCNSPCRTCMSHPSFCTSCEAGKGYLQTSAQMQSCVYECTDGTYAQNGVCQLCDFKCATCVGSKDHCLSCPAGQILYQSTCWGACPAIFIKGRFGMGNEPCCVDDCPSGFYKVSQSECAPCSTQCTTCEGSADNCTSCLDGSVTLGGQCTRSCQPNEFSFHGVCVSCSQSCNGCRYSPQQCIECASGYVRTGSICEKGCLSAQYYNQEQKKCKRCSPACKTCTSYEFCTSCHRENIVPRGGVCSECPYPCRTCNQIGKCQSCLSGFYFFLGQCTRTCPTGSIPGDGICRCLSGLVSNGYCVTNCQTGYTSINGECLPCNTNCAQCSGSINSCTQCISGFSLDASTQRCIPTSKCPYGQDLDFHGQCQNICPSSFYFYEGVCMFNQCKGGYLFNQHGGCVRSGGPNSTMGIQCPYGQYQHHGGCVSECESCFYADPSSKKCLACPDNCQVCSNPSYCYQCKDGYISFEGKCFRYHGCGDGQLRYSGGCVRQCPVGTSQQQGQCERNCPDGTYQMNMLCYISCPSELRTADACVSTCPYGTSNSNGVCK